MGCMAMANFQRLEEILQPLIVSPVATALVAGEIYVYAGYVVYLSLEFTTVNPY